MNLRKTWWAALSLAACSIAAHAAPVVYDGTLVPGTPVTGTVGGFSWFLDQGANVDYWRFQGVGGATVALTGRRSNGNLDPVLGLYFGTTTADTSQFVSETSWGGLTFIGSLDDELAPLVVPGPNGDAFGTFVLPFSGFYTVIVGGGLSTDGAAYPYSLQIAVVPEPAPFALLAAGLMASLVPFGLVRRRGRPRSA